MNPKRKKHFSNFQIPLTNSNCPSRFDRAEVHEVISNINPKKSSGYDLVTGKFLKEPPIIGIKYRFIRCSPTQRILPGAMIVMNAKDHNSPYI
jgi:hypothetical protein